MQPLLAALLTVGAAAERVRFVPEATMVAQPPQTGCGENGEMVLSKTTPLFKICVLKGTDDRYVSNEIRAKGVWSDCMVLPELGASIDNSVQEFVDVGANLGFCTLLMASKGYQVTAFEPVPQTADLLRRSIELNPDLKSRITLHNAAASAKKSQAVIWVDALNNGNAVVTKNGEAPKFSNEGSWKNTTIEMSTLDALISKKTALWKWDAQGHEPMVLEGAKALLANPELRPQLIKFEFWPKMMEANNLDPLAMLNTLDQSGYAIFVPEEAKQPAVPPAEFQNLIKKFGNANGRDLIAKAKDGKFAGVTLASPGANNTISAVAPEPSSTTPLAPFSTSPTLVRYLLQAPEQFDKAWRRVTHQ